jgi:hypothetical protein
VPFTQNSSGNPAAGITRFGTATTNGARSVRCTTGAPCSSKIIRPPSYSYTGVPSWYCGGAQTPAYAQYSGISNSRVGSSTGTGAGPPRTASTAAASFDVTSPVRYTTAAATPAGGIPASASQTRSGAKSRRALSPSAPGGARSSSSARRDAGARRDPPGSVVPSDVRTTTAYVVCSRRFIPGNGRTCNRFAGRNGSSGSCHDVRIGARRPRSGESGSTSTRNTVASGSSDAAASAGRLAGAIGPSNGK